MEKFDDISFYGRENEELQKEWERMFENRKQLLLKDLCARQPYGVKVKNVKNNFDISTFNHNVEEIKFLIEEYDIKPYLRPMSSMTAKEENFYYSCLDEMDGYKQTFPVIYQDKALSLLDFLNSHHFDYRGLIEKGLALEAPEGMYKF